MAQIWHMGLTVANFDASLAYYRDVARMTVTETLHRRSRATDVLLGRKPGSTELKVAYLQAGSLVLQLMHYVVGGGEPIQPGHNRPGSPHLCFYVEDVRATFDRIRARGDVTIIGEITQVAATMLSFYTLDPDRMPVEFLQVTPPVPDWQGSEDVQDGEAT